VLPTRVAWDRAWYVTAYPILMRVNVLSVHWGGKTGNAQDVDNVNSVSSRDFIYFRQIQFEQIYFVDFAKS
jgi:hypothetical protein